MIKNFTSTTLLVLALAVISNFCSGQQIRKRVDGTTTPYTYSFEIDTLTPTSNVSQFTQLWWFGDNGFSFARVPEHNFHRTGVTKICAITTENYGSGGAPPLIRDTVIPPSKVNEDFGVLAPGEYVKIQNYRNAVPGDTMYLLITYRNPHPESAGWPYASEGNLKLFVDPSTRILGTELQAHPEYMPNGEMFNGHNTWRLTGIGLAPERTILVPIQVTATRRTDVLFRVELWMDSIPVNGNNGHAKDAALVKVTKSHDPNIMIEESNAQYDCEYGGKMIHYDIHFENIGKGETHYVSVVAQLDKNVNMQSVRNIQFPWQYINPAIHQNQINGGYRAGSGIHYAIDEANHQIIFEFNDLALLSPDYLPGNDLSKARSSVSFDIDVNDGYVFGPPVGAYATIVFDDNPAIVTDTAYTSCENAEANTYNSGEVTFADGIICISYKWFWSVVIGLVLLILLLLAFYRKRTKK